MKAVPMEHTDYRPDPKSKTAPELCATIAMELSVLPGLVKTGTIDFSKGEMPAVTGHDDVIALATKSFEDIKAAVAGITDEAWENTSVAMIHPGGKWEAKLGYMMWHLVFDLIHHRGQLSTYLRAMGGKVPSIYGGSADSSM
jgi:hypothetical protein